MLQRPNALAFIDQELNYQEQVVTRAKFYFLLSKKGGKYGGALSLINKCNNFCNFHFYELRQNASETYDFYSNLEKEISSIT